MTDRDIETYDTLLASKVDVVWGKTDVQRLVDEVRRLKHELDVAQRPTALRDYWAGPRFVGGH